MIGPHEGQELELLLKQQKPMAAFADIIPASGMIAEEIIPEQKFRPYVENGKLERYSVDFPTPQGVMRIVCYATSQDIWRAKAYCFIRQKIHSGALPRTDATDILLGQLLGYSDKDISSFISA